ncbi:hypothetical protein P4M26_20090 [Pseudomonas aeruginosa]|nr:hypothetical protein [Pseudomonas aeruginosa]MDF5883140.1 hypothetical protein [Pseudomonas aeruginosa]MDF5991678.1 hypothetical protein [Pseudomonas aeruginosa]MDF5995100.1 hypothetical protein [Pseudomonas aeruginosa]
MTASSWNRARLIWRAPWKNSICRKIWRRFFPRSTLFRSGITFSSSVLPPGYVGPMTFALTNNHSEAFEIQIGARFAHVIFQAVSGDIGRYKGQWQGGRVSQPKDEGQI